jgi:hypothetical protein
MNIIYHIKLGAISLCQLFQARICEEGITCTCTDNISHKIKYRRTNTAVYGNVTRLNTSEVTLGR